MHQSLQTDGDRGSFQSEALHRHRHSWQAAAANPPASQRLQGLLLSWRHCGQRPRPGWKCDKHIGCSEVGKVSANAIACLRRDSFDIYSLQIFKLAMLENCKMCIFRSNQSKSSSACHIRMINLLLVCENEVQFCHFSPNCTEKNHQTLITVITVSWTGIEEERADWALW